MTPFRVKFIAQGCGLDRAVIWRNLARAQSYPRAQRGPHAHPVAVCGGSPSLVEHLEELRAWPGDIWAINATADWLASQGIEATLFTVDPVHCQSSVRKRLLATACDPRIFSQHVECFAMCEDEDGGVPGGTTSATRAPALALRLGYPGAVFFGCESSLGKTSHVDRNEPLGEALIVRADGVDWVTRPDYYLQAECLSHLLTEFPQVFTSKSGGLLDAMVRDPNWEVVAVSEALKRNLIEQNGDVGLYDKPYGCKSCGQVVGHYDDCEVGMGVL